MSNSEMIEFAKDHETWYRNEMIELVKKIEKRFDELGFKKFYLVPNEYFCNPPSGFLEYTIEKTKGFQEIKKIVEGYQQTLDESYEEYNGYDLRIPNYLDMGEGKYGYIQSVSRDKNGELLFDDVWIQYSERGHMGEDYLCFNQMIECTELENLETVYEFMTEIPELIKCNEEIDRIHRNDKKED